MSSCKIQLQVKFGEKGKKLFLSFPAENSAERENVPFLLSP